MFLYYENLGCDDMQPHLVRIYQEHGKVRFIEERVLKIREVIKGN